MKYSLKTTAKGFLASLLFFGMQVSAETLSETVARFEALGMPSVAGAEYVNISGAYQCHVEELGGCGNAWKLSEETLPDGNRSATFVINGGETVRFARRVGYGHQRINGLLTAEWEAMRLKRAAAQILQRLTFAQPESEENINFGAVFLFALQLQQYGDTEAAARLAQSLREKFGDEQVEASARGELSEALYRAACWRLTEHKDWHVFCAEVREVLKTAPEKWDWAPAVETVLDRAQSIAAHGHTPFPAGHSFTEAEQDLIKRLEAFPEFMSTFRSIYGLFGDRTLWLIPETWAHEKTFASEVERDVYLMGVKAVPLLLAVCDDPPMPKGTPQSFPHPTFRGEKAQQILRTIIPSAFQRLPQKPWEERPIREAALTFYATHKDASPETLALVYLEDQNAFNREDINQQAFNFLIRQSRSQPIPELETYFETVEIKFNSWSDFPARELSNRIVHYAANQGNEHIIKNFAARLDASADAYADVQPGESEWEQEQRKKVPDRLRKQAEQLRAIDLSISDEDLWKRFKSYNVDAVESILRARLDAMPFKDMYLSILKNTKSRQGIDWLRQRVESEGGPEKVRQWIQPTDGRDGWIQIWTPAMNEDYPYSFSCYTWIFESPSTYSIFFVDDYGRNARAKRGADTLKKRLLARVNGTPEDKLPKFSWEEPPLSTEQRAAIAGRFSTLATRQEAAHVAEQFSMIERETFVEICAEHPALAQELVRLSREIVEVSCTVEGAEAFVPRVGELLSPEHVRKLQQFCTEQVLTVCAAERKDNFGGWSIAITALTDANRCDILTGLAVADNRIEGMKSRLDSSTPKTADDEMQNTAFLKTVDEIITGTSGMQSPAFFRFSKQGDSKE